MPLELPNLDDRNYDDLVQEALSIIPTYAPDWTNYNPSDPGITLIELFAYLSEMLLYRLNRVTDQNLVSFLKLLNGSNWQPSGTNSQALASDLRRTIQKMRQQERAITCKDLEELALAADERVFRVRCLPRRDLRMDFDTQRNGHIGLIVFPKEDVSKEQFAEIIAQVKSDLEPRRLLTTRLHFAEPQYLPIKVQATVVPLPDFKEEDLKEKAQAALDKFFDPRVGGENNKGWQFGRSIFVSEIYQLLDRLPGVDYVTSVDLQRNEVNLPSRRIETEGVLVGLELKPYELVKLVEAEIKVDTARSS